MLNVEMLNEFFFLEIDVNYNESNTRIVENWLIRDFSSVILVECRNIAFLFLDCMGILIKCYTLHALIECDARVGVRGGGLGGVILISTDIIHNVM